MANSSQIETTRLHLRKPTNQDILLVRDLWKNEKVREFLGGIVSDNVIDGKIASIRDHWTKHNFGQWIVYDKNENQVIGICGLHHSEDGVEVSYMFFPEWWGKGIATEAVLASIDYGFNCLKLEKIIAITQEANKKSCHLLENIGMHQVDKFSRFSAIQCLYELKNKEIYC